MKPDLRRIEAMLDHLNVPFRQANAHKTLPESRRLAEVAPPLPQPSREPPAKSDVRPFPAQEVSPPLPKTKPPSFSSHRHATHPSLAVGLVREIETIVVGWQQELEAIVRQIQALYKEGPIVDGWLESHPHTSPQAQQSVGSATLRHAEIDRLMEFVEEICTTSPQPEPDPARTGYRLCGLDADGQLWCRPCPPQQVPYVGLAIARYQKLRVLLGQRQGIENRLQRLVQTLTVLHGQLRDPGWG